MVSPVAHCLPSQLLLILQSPSSDITALRKPFFTIASQPGYSPLSSLLLLHCIVHLHLLHLHVTVALCFEFSAHLLLYLIEHKFYLSALEPQTSQVFWKEQCMGTLFPSSLFSPPERPASVSQGQHKSSSSVDLALTVDSVSLALPFSSHGPAANHSSSLPSSPTFIYK